MSGRLLLRPTRPDQLLSGEGTKKPTKEQLSANGKRQRVASNEPEGKAILWGLRSVSKGFPMSSFMKSKLKLFQAAIVCAVAVGTGSCLSLGAMAEDSAD